VNLLFDTHIFIWWDSEPARLSQQILTLCQDPANRLWLSIASIWEIQIKHQLGKLQLQQPLAEIVEWQQQVNRISLLPIEFSHVLALAQFPAHHKDPFDRMLIAQASVEELTLMSVDPIFKAYGIDVLS
jgi:PIN domain nuclease of toxin-antitoxin system